MAMKTGAAPLRGLALVTGSKRLILLRWALICLSGIPGWIAARGIIGGDAARSPYFADPVGALSINRLVRLLGEIGPAFGIAIGAAAAVALIGNWVLFPGAVGWLDRVRQGERLERVFSTVVRGGTPRLWTMLRITLLAAIAAAAGIGLLSAAFSRLDLLAERWGWESVTRAIYLPRLRMLLAIVWIALVGAWAFWCRLIVSCDDRWRVRSAGLLVLRAWRRALFAGPLLFVLATLLGQLVGGWYLFAWRQHPPRGATLAAWICGWLLLQLLLAAAWHWLLRSGMLSYTAQRMFPVRSAPDRPWYLLRRVLRRPLPGEPETLPGPQVIDSNLRR